MTLNNAALDEAQRTPEKFSILESIGGPQFIVAQLFTIAATVLGVYLAGYVGFQRTLEYDRYVKAQQQSDLLTAVYAELKDNVARVNEFAGRIDPSGAESVGEWPRLRLFVWNAAGQTTSAFDIPPVALSGMQALYDEVGETLGNPRAREWFKTSSNFFSSDRMRMKETLLRNVRNAETLLLPALQQAAAASGDLITKYRQVAP
ncbi:MULTISPECIES: hypothetical protein [Rhodomicrobium]|uniref:hypothetical protein n=1 Tax=Rhodomicrobium TaxID=1068 RepID=UPI000B4BF8B6|nr:MULTISPECIES: hypothetical protein [Rhodomicrobium]